MPHIHILTACLLRLVECLGSAYFLPQTKGFLVLDMEKRVSSVLFHTDKRFPSRMTYGENSPSLWPTICSVMVTSWYTLPLYTWNFSPTKLGRMVAERACVRIGGVFFPATGRVMGSLRGR